MPQLLKQRIFLKWIDRPMGVLFELDGTQANVLDSDFAKTARADDVVINISGHMGTVNQYTFTLPQPEKINSQ